MLTPYPYSFGPRRVGGFSLIEMMISVVMGMIVAAGAVSLIVAIDKSNSETIQATRLTQELQALSAVIADDIKRARRIDDPIAKVAQGSTNNCATTPTLPAQPCYTFSTSQGTNACVAYGYSGTTSTSYVYNYRSIRRTVTGGVGSIVLDQLAFDPTTNASGTALPAVACQPTGSTSYALSSNQVNITSLCFSSASDASTCYFNATNGDCELDTTSTHVPAANEVDVCIAAKLVSGDVYEKTITRAFVQPIYIQSPSISGS
jgi:type II secretory pathway component PulJ